MAVIRWLAIKCSSKPAERTSHAGQATESRRRVGQCVAAHRQRAPSRGNTFTTLLSPLSPGPSAFNCQTNTTLFADQTAKAHLAMLRGPSAQP
ncbi:hypothetical protein [Xylella fastidiosa]|uniref:hypothetical protein n=1 Tax=Xylella fastidiosa TaxID=2371 RepID=UPI003984F1E7